MEMFLCNVCGRDVHGVHHVYGLLPIEVDEETGRITSKPAGMKLAVHEYCFEKIVGYFARRAHG